MRNKGFTLIELLVSISIIVIITGIVFASYRTSQQQLTLQRAASKLTQDIRRIGEMALAAEKVGGVVPPGYGIYLTSSEQEHYILFADSNDDKDYDSGLDIVIEDIEIEKGVKIETLSGSPLNIVFSPPDPSVTISSVSPAWIRLSINSQSKTIYVNEAGVIHIE